MSEQGGVLGPVDREPLVTSSVVTDQLGRILSVDDLFVRYSGAGSRDVVGTLLEEYVCPEDRLQFLTLLSALKGDRVVGVVRFCLSNQGIVSARIVIDPGSSRSTFAMTITEQTASSQEMVDGGQDGHRLAHAILEQTQDTIMVLDPGGRVLMSSPSARALVGRDPVGLDFFFCPPP